MQARLRTAPMKLLALDFDGVIADSAPEAYVVALRTWCELHPDSRFTDRGELLAGPAAPAPDAIRLDTLYAEFLAMMPLGNRAEDYAVEFAAAEAGVALADQAAYDAFKSSLDPDGLRTFHKLFYRVRAAMADADAVAWHELMGPYPGVPDVLRRRAGDVVLAIATAKDRASVARLLAAYGLVDLFPKGRVLDKETGLSKRSHLELLSREHGIDFAEMTFVDDKVSHLESVALLGVRCGLAGWGYNGEREAAQAREHRHLVLRLDDFEAQLFGG